MDALFEIDDRDVLEGWLDGRGRRRRRGVGLSAAVVRGARFAFYGRTSTAEFQDPVSSRAWQREVAGALIEGRGTIVVDFFDVGCSRRVPWKERSRAAVLLERASAAGRAFDAVVVGEFERAFTGRQFRDVAAALAAHGVALWLPETGGPVDLDDPVHRVLMQVLGAHLRSVAVILANPRYTGRQVWSRRRSQPGVGRSTVAGEWVMSKTLSHPALVTAADFVAVQLVRAAREGKDGMPRAYVLAGLVQCELCGRRMDSHWVNGRAGYRCRHGHNSARTRPLDAAQNLYVREDVLLARLVRHLAPDRVRSDVDVEPSAAVEVAARCGRCRVVCGRSDWTIALAT